MRDTLDIRSLVSRTGADALVDLVGGTPLIPIGGLSGVAAEVAVLGKAEWRNPGGSVKDRAALGMVREGRASGAFAAGRRLIDATSGNTGIAYAWLGAALGFPVTLCVPGNASAERFRLLDALGAEIVATDPLGGTDAAIAEARRRVAQDPGAWFYPDQYSNPANWRAHYHGTAEEIWSQTEGRVTHLVACVGTSGTIVGAARRLRELDPAIEAIAVQPDSPLHVLEGVKHLASCRVPEIYDRSAHQRTLEVSSEAAIDMVKAQARRGLLLGWSAGAALAAAEQVARRLARGVVVAILPDAAERYLSGPLWERA
jgi:cysteine synthase B